LGCGAAAINRSRFVALLAQFQTYFRELHNDAIDVPATRVSTQQQELVSKLMSQGRRLDAQTHRTSVPANDFSRVGFNIVRVLKAQGSAMEAALSRLDVAVDFRNAIVHGNETQVARVAASGHISPDADLVPPTPSSDPESGSTRDQVTATGLGGLLQIPSPR
jgi:hypothetical protein